MNKKGEANKIGSFFLGALIFVVLISVISGLLRQPTTYGCFDDDYPYLNESDNLCYNATEPAFSTDTATNIGFSTTEQIMGGLIVIVLIISLIIGAKKVFGKSD